MTEVTTLELKYWSMSWSKVSTYFTNKFSKYNNQIDLENKCKVSMIEFSIELTLAKFGNFV